MRRQTKQAAEEGGLSRDADPRGRSLSVACVMQRHATEAERAEAPAMMARVSADVCHRVISCPNEFLASLHMSVSVPSGQVGGST